MMKSDPIYSHSVLIAGFGLWFTTTSLVDSFSVRPVTRQLAVGSMKQKVTKLHVSASQDYLSSLPDIAEQRDLLATASQACLDGLSHDLSQISGVPMTDFDSSTFSADEWSRAVERSMFEVLSGVDDADQFFFASMDSQPDMTVAVTNNNIAQEGISSVAAQIIEESSKSVPHQVAAAADVSGSVATIPQASLMEKLNVDMSTVDPSILNSGVEMKKSGGETVQNLFASIADKTSDIAEAAKTSLADSALSAPDPSTNSLFSSVSQTIAEALSKGLLVIDSEKAKLVQQGNEAAKTVGAKHMNEIVDGLGAGLQALTKFLMMVLDVFLQAVTGHTLAETAAGAQSYMIGTVNHAIEYVQLSLKHFGERSVVDVVTEFATITVQVVKTLFEVTNVIVAQATGKDLTAWVSEWSHKVGGYIQHESSVLLQKMSTSAMDFGERSVSEIIALLTTFFQAVGRIMAESLNGLGGAALTKGQLVSSAMADHSLAGAMTSNTVASVADTVHMVSSNMM